MLVRLALESDEQAVVDMARANIAETRPDLRFNEAACRDTFRSYLATAEPTIFVVEARGRRVVGMLVGSIVEHRAAYGLFTVQEVMFVQPEHRGTRAAAELMRNFVTWSQRLGATEIIGGNDNSFRSDRMARFLGRFGFEQVGVSMRRKLTNGPVEIGR